MKNKQELKLFIDDFLGEHPPSFFVSKVEGVLSINFVNCCNWSACFHHQNLNKIEQLKQCLNGLNFKFSINKIA